MTITEEIQHSVNKSKPCYMERIIQAFGDRQSELQEAVFNPKLTLASIRRYLGLQGYKISEHSIRLHRVKECSCQKTV